MKLRFGAGLGAGSFFRLLVMMQKGARGFRERARYARHLLLPGVGLAGQRRLRAASACVVGAGGLGSPALLYLAAAGVGRVGVVDDDAVDVTNLQRQVLHDTRGARWRLRAARVRPPRSQSGRGALRNT